MTRTDVWKYSVFHDLMLCGLWQLLTITRPSKANSLNLPKRPPFIIAPPPNPHPRYVIKNDQLSNAAAHEPPKNHININDTKQKPLLLLPHVLFCLKRTPKTFEYVRRQTHISRSYLHIGHYALCSTLYWGKFGFSTINKTSDDVRCYVRLNLFLSPLVFPR